jgi:hypothetical protein
MYRVTSFPVHAQSKDATTAAGFHHACSLFLGCRDGDGLLESAFHAVAALVTAAIGIGLAVESIPSDVDLTNVPVSRHLVSQVVHLALLGWFILIDSHLRRWVDAPPRTTSLLPVNKAVSAEATQVLYGHNSFVFEHAG